MPKVLSLSVLAALVWSGQSRAAEDLRPSILFCSPQGAAYGWVDLTYLAELHERGFQVDYTETLQDVTTARIQRYNLLAIYQPRRDHRQPGPNGRTPSGQGVWDRAFPLDPYVVPGEPRSGLLPLVQAGEPGVPGDPAPGVQAYCYRLCLTTAADRISLAPPPDYDPQRYELVARFIAACLAIGDDMGLRWFAKQDPLPNDKWDFNTATFHEIRRIVKDGVVTREGKTATRRGGGPGTACRAGVDHCTSVGRRAPRTGPRSARYGSRSYPIAPHRGRGTQHRWCGLA